MTKSDALSRKDIHQPINQIPVVVFPQLQQTHIDMAHNFLGDIQHWNSDLEDSVQ
jgi:hypothetical protein